MSRASRNPVPPRPEVVFLDVGDTLIRAHPSWAAVYRQGLLEVDIDIGEDDLDRALLQEMQAGAWWLSEEPFEATPEESFARVVKFDAAVLARLGHAHLPDEAFRRIEDAFARRSAWYVYPDVLPCLGAMRDAGLRMCVISNFVWGGTELIHDLDLARHFEALVISARVGFQKPNEGIFRHALRIMNGDPARSWHVGDSYKADILGARRVGIHGVMIAREARDAMLVRQEHDDPDLVVVTDLLELVDLLGIERPALSPA